MFNREYALECILRLFMSWIIRFWTEEFRRFYDPVAGLDIDGAWIDMNEPTNVSCCFMRNYLYAVLYMQFCRSPSDDPFQQAKERNVPPPRRTLPPHPSTPIFTDSSGSSRKGFQMIGRAVEWVEKKMSRQPSSLLSYNPIQAAVNVPMSPSNSTHPETVTSVTNSTGGLNDRDLLNPPYGINNAAGSLSSRTLAVSSLLYFCF